MSKILNVKVIKQTNAVNTASVIFLHGSGDTGPGVLDWVKFVVNDFSFPHIKLLFPTAPLRPYTAWDGEKNYVWFDRLSVSPDVPEHLETIDDMGKEIVNLIDKEVAAGIPKNRIVIGGFSMGGCLALHTAYRFTQGLAGIFALSSFLNKGSAVYSSLQKNKDYATTPLFMCHGDRDTLVPLQWGQETFENLSQLGVKGDFHTLKNTLHELKKKEVEQLSQWFYKVLPEKT